MHTKKRTFLANLEGEFAMAQHSVHPYFVPSAALPADRRRANTPASDKGGLDGARTLAGMLLAAVAAALLVVADQLLDTWADGHLLLAWVVLWSVAFATLAVLATPLRRTARNLTAGLARWSALQAQRQSDAAIWRVAQQDHRIMQDLQMALLRGRHGA
jgi:hypothetical protein